MAAAISDATLARELSRFAGMAGRVLAEPERWLAADDGPGRGAQVAAGLLGGHRGDGALPGSPAWAAEPVDRRVDWWVGRIGTVGGLAAAAPRLAGALADRVPLQGALGASAAALAVCAVAREHGVTEPGDWVPLIARVVLRRDLPSQESATLPSAGESQRALEDDGAAGGGVSLAAGTLWRLARTFSSVQGLLEERPRGGLMSRALGKAPVVGALGGWLDERAGVRKAADETARLLGR
jgi:hypothetical protein